MPDLKTERRKAVEINLLSGPNVTQRLVPYYLRRTGSWKVFSGRWKLELPDRIIYHKDSKQSSTENASVIGSPDWEDFALHVTFKMLSDSIKPPEGGVILFFLFKNIRNHYSFHFCLYKQKVELIKRYQGVWTTIAEHNYTFEPRKEYLISISTAAGVHRCEINGVDQIQIYDGDIPRGCIGLGAKYCDAEFNKVSVSVP